MKKQEDLNVKTDFLILPILSEAHRSTALEELTSTWKMLASGCSEILKKYNNIQETPLKETPCN